MHTSSRISELTFAILNGNDDETLDLIADAAHTQLACDAFFVVLPLTDTSWVCEIARGRFSTAILGSEVSGEKGASAVDSGLAFALMQDSDRMLQTLNWRDYARGLTGNFLIPGTTAAGDDIVDPGTPVGPETDAALATHAILTRRIEASGTPSGLAVAVRFRAHEQRAFSEADSIALEAYASLYSFALRASSGISAIEDDLRDERNRIARDLHDLAIQELFAVGMQLESTQEQATKYTEFSPEGPVAHSLKLSVTGIEKSIAQIREIVQSLRNESSEVTLSQRIRHECGMSIAGLGFAPSLQFHSPVDDIDSVTGDLEEDVVAVVKECLANAARHAHASAVAVSISMFREGVDDVIQVNVSDNGRGIDPAVVRRSGLANMRSRARRHMGWVDFYSLEPGTMVSWRATRFAE